MKVTCSACKGTGDDPLSDNMNWLTCQKCGGAGQVEIPERPLPGDRSGLVDPPAEYPPGYNPFGTPRPTRGEKKPTAGGPDELDRFIAGELLELAEALRQRQELLERRSSNQDSAA